MLIGSMRMSALHLAAQEGNVDCAALLLNRGADPHAKNARGQSALHLAALSQSPETMELLLFKGKDINICFQRYLSRLLWSSSSRIFFYINGRYHTLCCFISVAEM